MKNLLFIFGQLTDEDVDWLTENGEVRYADAGEVLVREGEPIDRIYIVLEGDLKVSSGGVAIARLGGGVMIGEISFVDASPPSADVTAVLDSAVFGVPREVLAARLEADPDFAARFYRAIAMMLSDRLREATYKLTDTRKPRAEGVLEPGELDPNVLENVTRAGERFDRMLRQLRGA